jgi:glycosyltransferase involved in cell wall biosynthesis
MTATRDPIGRAPSTIRVLAISDYYLPGFRGGSFRALATIVDRMGERYDFRIVTGDRDVGQAEPYAGIDPDGWNVVGRARVRYLRPAERTASTLRRVVREIRPDLLFVFSLFSPLTIRLLLLRRLGRLDRVPVLLAPEGEFSPGALAQKRWKKRVFLLAARVAGLYRHLSWKATSDLEVQDIRRAMGPAARVFLAPSLPPRLPAGPASAPPPLAKAPGRVRLVYLSRVTPKKNLCFVIEELAALRGAITLDVVGPIEDERYWAACLDRVKTLAAGVEVRYLGDVPHERVFDEIAARHFMVLPTLGENFGFAIYEALAVGRPIVVSDRTPWRDLARTGAGWDLPLDDRVAWRQALQRSVDMDDAEYQRMSRAAWMHARAYAESATLETAVARAMDETAESIYR